MSDDLLSLKVHVDEQGKVWYLNGNSSPVQTEQSVVQFLLNPLSHEIPNIRIVALPQNLHLILTLHKRGLNTVEVCGPMVCQSTAERRNPAVLLMAMRNYSRPVSIGGWHKLRDEDYKSFALAVAVQKANGVVDDKLRPLLTSHPAWLTLSFIPHLREDACIKLLATILDPRWFVNPSNPARNSNLKSFLGLDLKTMAGVHEKGPRQRHHERCKMVLDAWTGEHNIKIIERPDYFLWRVRRAAFEKREDVVYADLRASQMFIDYLRLCWLAMLGQKGKQAEPLFIPEYFFQERYESKAFYEHIRKAIGVIDDKTDKNPSKRKRSRR